MKRRAFFYDYHWKSGTIVFWPCLYFNRSKTGKDHFLYFSFLLWSVGYRWTDKATAIAREEELRHHVRVKNAKQANAQGGARKKGGKK